MDNTVPMGMLLQDPSIEDLHQNYQFSLDKDFLIGMASSKFVVRDSDEHDNPLFAEQYWEEMDLSYEVMNKNKDYIDNPQFHQVNVFAVATHTLDFVESLLGREMKWKHGGPLVLRPHAIRNQANAYYNPQAPSLNFGSFHSDFRRTPIWTCLSHDIISHELGHAILDSFRPFFNSSEEIDTGALHESIGDLLSLFCALEHRPVIERVFRDSRGDVMQPTILTSMAEEFGLGMHGINFPFLRSALLGYSYDEAPEEVHDRSTVWTSAIYEIFAELVYELIPADTQEILSNAPEDANDFDDYYNNEEHKKCYDKFFEVIKSASRRVKGMMLRSLHDVPPTGVTFPTLARVLYNSDARLFPDDPMPRDIARDIFEGRMLWVEEIMLDATDIGTAFAGMDEARPSDLMRVVYDYAYELRIPIEMGAQIMYPKLRTSTRTIDGSFEGRSNGTQTITEHRLYYTYEILIDGCYIGENGEPVMGMVAITKGGTLIMDENWNAIQLATDPDYYPDDEEGDLQAGDSPAVNAYHRAVRRFTKLHHRSLRAIRDGHIHSNGELDSGQHAFPFNIVPQASGAPRLMRRQCNLSEHLKNISDRHKEFPFDI